MRLFVGGFYGEPLKWMVHAETEQEATKKFSEIIKNEGATSFKGTREIAVFEAKEELL